MNYKLGFLASNVFFPFNYSYTLYLNIFLLWVNPFYFKLFLLFIGIAIYPNKTYVLILFYLYFIDLKLFDIFNSNFYVDLFIYESHNPLLFNSLNKIHPAIFHILLIWILIPILSNKYLKYTSYKFIKLISFVYTLIIYLITTIFFGSWWAVQEGTWGGWWDWDPSEVLSLVVLSYLIYILHSLYYLNMCIFFYRSIISLFILIVVYFIGLQLIFGLTNHNFGNSNLSFFNNNNYSMFTLLLWLWLIIIIFRYFVITSLYLNSSFSNLLIWLSIIYIALLTSPLSITKIATIWNLAVIGKVWVILTILVSLLIKSTCKWDPLVFYSLLFFDLIAYILIVFKNWSNIILYHFLFFIFFLFSFLYFNDSYQIVSNYLITGFNSSYYVNFSYLAFINESHINLSPTLKAKSFIFNFFNTSILYSYLISFKYTLSYNVLISTYLTNFIYIVMSYNLLALTLIVLLLIAIIFINTSLSEKLYIV